MAVMKFNREQTNANYGLAFAVIENDVTGYKQRNAYAGSVKSYYGWEKKGKEVELDLQHVARLGYEVNEGISDVFPKQINSGDAFSHTVELNLPHHTHPLAYGSHRRRRRLAHRLRHRPQLEVR